MSLTPHNSGVHVRLVLTMIFWGGTFVAGRILAEELHPLTAASLRFILASAMLLTTLKIRYGTLPRLDNYDGVKSLGAGRAAMYVNLVPVSGVSLGVLLLGERLGSSLIFGGSLVFFGLYLINRRPSAALTSSVSREKDI